MNELVMLFLSDGSKVIGRVLDESESMRTIQDPALLQEVMESSDESMLFSVNFAIIPFTTYSKSNVINFSKNHTVAITPVNDEVFDVYQRDLKESQKMLDDRRKDDAKPSGVVVQFRKPN